MGSKGRTRHNTSLKIVPTMAALLLLGSLLLCREIIHPETLSVRQALCLVGIIATIGCAISVVILLYVSRTIDFFLIFILLSYLFSFGQSFAVLLNLDAGFDGLLYLGNGNFSSSTIFYSALSVLQMITSFVIGYVLFYERKCEKVACLKEGNKRLLKCGRALIIINIIPSFYLAVKDLVNVLNSSYANSRENLTKIDSILTLFSSLFYSGLIMSIIGETNKRRKRLVYLLMTCYFIIELLGGSRFDLFRFGVMFVIIVIDRHKKIRIKDILKTVALVCFFGLILSVVSSSRQSSIKNINDLVLAITTSIEEGGVVGKVFFETGITQLFNAVVFENCPQNIDFCYGASLYKIVLGCIPNLGFWNVHPTGITTEVVFSPLYANFGLGSSLWSEFYWNFGLVGACVILVLFGVIVSRISHKHRVALRSDNKIFLFIIYYLIYYFSISIRSDMTQIGRDLVYYAVLPLLISKLFRKKTTFAKQISFLHNNNVIMEE